MTSPTPVRAGPVDISVLVQDADSGRPLLDVPILVQAQSIQHPRERLSAPATNEAATNKLFHASVLDLSTPGTWHFEVVPEDMGQEQPIQFDLEVDETLPRWLDQAPWIGWPVLAIAIFAIHRALVHRRRAGGREQAGAPASARALRAKQ
jgi:hypothetical protein